MLTSILNRVRWVFELEYSQTCIQQQLLGPLKSGRCSLFRRYIFRGYLGSGWSLLTCGHCLEVVVNTGLTVSQTCLQRPALGPQNCGLFVQRLSYLTKIEICSIKLGLLHRGGRYSEVAVRSGLTVLWKTTFFRRGKKYGKIGRFVATYQKNTSYPTRSLMS